MTTETAPVSDKAIRPPFRILPGRDRDFSIEVVLIVGGLCAVIGGAVVLSDRSGVGLVLLLPGLIAFFGGCSRAIREYRFFHSQSEYALVVGLDAFKVVTPNGTESCAWSELGPFEVKQTVTKGKYGEHITYQCIAHVNGVEVDITLRDFAVLFGLDREERANGITKALNQVRDLMQGRQNGEVAPLFGPPLGLVVGPLLPPKKAQPIKVRSVVQRQ